MNIKIIYAQFEWSFFAIYCYFHNQNISFIEQGAWKKVALLFNGAGRWMEQGAPLCACCFCACISLSCIEATNVGLLTKSEPFFLAPDFINSVISQYNGEYGQWMTTQNLRKKILHALHFKYTILIKYFSGYIKKCQMGTYFFGWVYNVAITGSKGCLVESRAKWKRVQNFAM